MKILFVRAFTQILKRADKFRKNPLQHDSAATKKWRSESGQSVILISMVLMSFIMFFGFAINTGLLITAKISVQAAADAAAYAGAATQARQLNAISYLNYDMRRQFKKFLYRYNFMGSAASMGGGTPPTSINMNKTVDPTHYGYPKKWYSGSSSSDLQTTAIKVPVICIPMTGSGGGNDYCQQLNTPNSTKMAALWFPNKGLTTVTQAMLSTMGYIESSLDEQCKKYSNINLFVLMEWLFRGNLDPTSLENTLGTMASAIKDASERQQAVQKIDTLVNGLGLYPRNLFNYMRITTLQQFLNDPPSTVTQDQVKSLESNQSAADSHERTIQAFKSVLVNLNNDVLDHSKVSMMELQPQNQINIELVEASFNAYVQYMQDAPVDPNADTRCQSNVVPFQVNNAPVGVNKTSSNTIYYAVKVKATAKLLFLPISDGIELEAFASAKPFGSRIGPTGSNGVGNLTEADFVETVKPDIPPGLSPTGSDCAGLAGTQCKLPNLHITDGDTFYSSTFLDALYHIGGVQNTTGKGLTLSYQGMDNAEAPEPKEIGHYNIIPPPKSDMGGEYIPYAVDQNSSIYRFYAPIFTGTADVNAQITTMLGKVFSNAVSGTNNFFNIDTFSLKTDLLAQMTSYASAALKQGSTSENGETETFAALELPMVPHSSNPPKPIQPSPQSFWLTRPEQVLSSWSPPHLQGAPNPTPRFGYSVKFVAMQNVLQGSSGPDEDQEKVEH